MVTADQATRRHIGPTRCPAWTTEGLVCAQPTTTPRGLCDYHSRIYITCPRCGGEEYLDTDYGVHLCPRCRGAGLTLRSNP